MKKVAVLGSTGSIGTQALDVIRRNPDKLKVESLVAFSNSDKLELQSKEFNPKYTALIDSGGKQCLIEAVAKCDVALVATRGIIALDSVLYCLRNGIDVALANKEVLVAAGDLVMPLANDKAKLIPVDSEHSAIYQSMKACPGVKPKKLLLTASGGAFYGINKSDLSKATAEQALRHPNWNMGLKITVDSATMMNKAFEVTEARHLFGMQARDIEIVVHRQSIIHSMVEYADGTVIAELSAPDMRIPIAYALLKEERVDSDFPRLDFASLKALTFEPCDFDKFPCASFGYIMADAEKLMPTVLNAANDVCVDKFLSGKLFFDGIYNTIQQTLKRFESEIKNAELSIEAIEYFDSQAKSYAQKLINGEKC